MAKETENVADDSVSRVRFAREMGRVWEFLDKVLDSEYPRDLLRDTAKKEREHWEEVAMFRPPTRSNP